MIESFEQFITGKMFDLLSNSDRYMTDYAINNGLANPKNGYISNEARAKARKKRKKRK